MKNLIIIGVGGFAREVFWHAQESHGFKTDWQVKGFLDGDIKLSDEDYKKLPPNIPVLGSAEDYKICVDDVFACAIGIPTVRRRLIEKILSRGGEFINIISRYAHICSTAKIGRGIIAATEVSFSDNSEVGDFVVLNKGAYLGHDATVGKYSCVMANCGINGNAKIGEEVFIGTGAVILPRARVGDGAYVGAGSVVLKKVRAGSKVFGNPAAEI